MLNNCDLLKFSGCQLLFRNKGSNHIGKVLKGRLLISYQQPAREESINLFTQERGNIKIIQW